MKEKIKYCTHCGRKHSRSNAMNLCRKHEWQLEKYGKYLDCNPRNKFDKNAYQIKDGKVYVELYDSKTYEVCDHFIVDVEDLPLILKHKWYTNKGGYVRTASYDGTFLHHMLLDFPQGVGIDHINKNLLDNTRANLRIVGQGVNNANRNPYNTLGVKGAERAHSKKEAYTARFRVKGKRYYSGTYRTIEEAAFARFILEQMFSDEYITPCNTDLHDKLTQEQKTRIIDKLREHYNK